MWCALTLHPLPAWLVSWLQETYPTGARYTLMATLAIVEGAAACVLAGWLRWKGWTRGSSIAAGACFWLLLWGSFPSTSILALQTIGLILCFAALVLCTAGLQVATSGAFGRGVLSLWRRVLRLPVRLFLLVSFGLATGLTLVLTCLLFRAAPVTVDGACYLFLANVFRLGHVSLPLPVEPDLAPFFATPLIGGSESWFIQHPPGYAVLLAAGAAAGVPHAVNPVLNGLLAVAMYGLGREVGGDHAGRGAALLGAVSPLLLVFGATFLAHTATALFLTAFAYAFFRSRHRPWIWPLLAGFFLGCGAGTRPYTAMMAAIPFLFLGIGYLRRRPNIFFRRLAILMLGAVVPIGLFLLYNLAITGSAVQLGYQAIHGSGHNIGFGLRGFQNASAPFTPWMGFVHTQTRTAWLQDRLTLWPVPVFLLVLMAILGRQRLRGRTLLAVWACLASGYGAYFSRSISCIDMRFLTESAPGLLVLAVLGLQRLPLEKSWKAGGVAVAVVITLVFRFPLDANLYRNMMMGMRDRADPALAALHEKRAILFYNGVKFSTSRGLCADPLLLSPLLLATPQGRADRRLRARFPDRPEVYYLTDHDRKVTVYREIECLEDLTRRPPPPGGVVRTQRHLGAQNRLVILEAGQCWRFDLEVPPDAALAWSPLAFGNTGGPVSLRIRVNGLESCCREYHPPLKWKLREGFLALPEGSVEVEISVEGSGGVAMCNLDLIRFGNLMQYGLDIEFPVPWVLEPGREE